MEQFKEVIKERDVLLAEHKRLSTIQLLLRDRSVTINSAKGDKKKIEAINQSILTSIKKEWRGKFFSRGLSRLEAQQVKYQKKIIKHLQKLTENKTNVALLFEQGQPITLPILKERVEVFTHELVRTCSQFKGSITINLRKKEPDWEQLSKDIGSSIQSTLGLIAILEKLSVHQEDIFTTRCRLLTSYGFDCGKNKTFTKLLVAHWEDVEKLRAHFKENSQHFFGEFIILFSTLIEQVPSAWLELVKSLVKISNNHEKYETTFNIIKYIGAANLGIITYGYPGDARYSLREVLIPITTLSTNTKTKSAIIETLLLTPILDYLLRPLNGSVTRDKELWFTLIDDIPRIAKVAYAEVTINPAFSTFYQQAMASSIKRGLLTREYWPEILDIFINHGRQSVQIFGWALHKLQSEKLLYPSNTKLILQLFARLSKQEVEIIIKAFAIANDRISLLIWCIENYSSNTVEYFHQYLMWHTLSEEKLRLFTLFESPTSGIGPLLLRESPVKLGGILSLMETNEFIGLKQSTLMHLNIILDRWKKNLNLPDTTIITALKASGFDHTKLTALELVYLFSISHSQSERRLKKINESLISFQKDERSLLNTLGSHKTISTMGPIERERFFGALKRISLPLLEGLFSILKEEIDDLLIKLSSEIGISVKSIKECMDHPSGLNAIILSQKVEHDYKVYCYHLLRASIQKTTYPHSKPPLSYPWSILENQAWIKKYNISKQWYNKIEKVYTLKEDATTRSNIPERIQHHLQDSINIIKKLGVPIPEQTTKKILKLYSEIAKERTTKYQTPVKQALVDDLKTQVDAIKTLEGEQAKPTYSGKKIVITPEFDPLEILQMGNYVAGSCLSLYGSNNWSAIVNAIEVNKRVLWAKDEHGKIIARMLIAIDSQKGIVQFPIYYATHIPLEDYFKEYLKSLATECKFTLNGKANWVQKLIFPNWYHDTELVNN